MLLKCILKMTKILGRSLVKHMSALFKNLNYIPKNAALSSTLLSHTAVYDWSQALTHRTCNTRQSIAQSDPY